ncbi:MAG: hypothetical protein JXA94_07590 [Parachlamydiales bacterium]|nr:hypothetical protein [Parachlamydiales bacterium]
MTSIFLGKIIGLYFIVTSIAYLVNPRHCKKVLHDIIASNGLSALCGSIALILGFILILNHNIWNDFYQIVITLISWGILIFGLLIIFFKDTMEKISKKLQKHHGYTWFSLIILLVGLYLVYWTFFYLR